MAKTKQEKLEYNRQYRIKHRERLLKYAIEYYDKHKAEIAAKRQAKAIKVNQLLAGLNASDIPSSES
jgi:hypothetical protein